MRQVVNLETGEITLEEDAPVIEQTLEQIQAQINQEALAYLNSTDWYVVRFVETAVIVPQEITDARQQARQRIV